MAMWYAVRVLLWGAMAVLVGDIVAFVLFVLDRQFTSAGLALLAVVAAAASVLCARYVYARVF